MTTPDTAPVYGELGTRATDTICKRLDEDRYLIDGREVMLPLEVNACSVLLNAFLVDGKAARTLVDVPGYRLSVPLPGKALMVLLGVDYQDNPLGDYHEAAVLFAMEPSAGPRVPIVGALVNVLRGGPLTYVHKMPVTQEFTMHAGRFIWGFPKWVSDVQVRFSQDKASARFVDQNHLVFSIEAPARDKGAAPSQASRSLSLRGGVTRTTAGTLSGRGVGFRLGGTAPEIGESHPLAQELRALGLPKRPLFSVSIRNATMRFSGPG